MVSSVQGEKTLSSLPDSLEKRDLLHGAKKMSAAEAIALGQKLESEGWLSDASDFYRKAEARDQLESLALKAIEDGDAFLLIKVKRFIGAGEASEGELKSVASNAEKLGKLRFAIKAFELLGRTEDVARIKASISGDGDIVAEAEAEVFIPENEDPFVLDDEGDEE